MILPGAFKSNTGNTARNSRFADELFRAFLCGPLCGTEKHNSSEKSFYLVFFRFLEK
jgi:hypothetical protein